MGFEPRFELIDDEESKQSTTKVQQMNQQTKCTSQEWGKRSLLRREPETDRIR